MDIAGLIISLVSGAVGGIERGNEVGQVDVGLPVGVDRADVAPVGLRLGTGANAGALEAVRDRAAVAHHVGDDVLAEVVARVRIGGVALQLLEEQLAAKDVDAHARKRDVGAVGEAGRVRGRSAAHSPDESLPHRQSPPLKLLPAHSGSCPQRAAARCRSPLSAKRT